ncbi:MAG: hypothetical protein ACMUIP_10930 [bacterium]
MLREIQHVRQIEGENKRRWFSDHYFDLIIWTDENEKIVGFQLCYDKSRYHRVVTWNKETGFAHDCIDDGENRPGKIKATPILVMDGVFEYEKIADNFKKESTDIEDKIAAFVYNKIMEYPSQ